MAKDIQCEKKLIRDIFKLWFRIPDYQRPYVWGEDQVKDLLDDTLEAYHSNADSQYFLGSMVLKINNKKEDSLEYTEYELLDGQQRLSTMLLFFATVRDYALQIGNAPIVSNCRNAIFQEENFFEDQPERIRIIFDIRDIVKDFINKYVKVDGGTDRKEELKKMSEDKEEDISIRNMASAIIVMKSFLDEHGDEIEGFFKYFFGKVLMIYVATEELDDAFQLFTVLNNRGIRLNNSDILKAQNLKEISQDYERKQWAKKWEEMETYFSEDFDKFLSHIRTILVKRKASQNLLKEFDENIYSSKVYNRTTKEYEERTPLLNRGKDTFEYISEYFKVYTDLFEKNHFDVNGDYDIYNYLTLMNYGLGADYWVAPVMEYYKYYGTNGLLEFLKQIDKKVSADWIVSLSPTQRIENVNAILQQIEKSGSKEEIFASDVFDVDIESFERIIKGNIYGRRFARYLLMKLDLIYQSNSVQLNPPSTISIEHILPQHPSEGSGWKNDFSDDARDEWTDKLGNLILISRRKNTAQGNLDYEIKVKKYFEKNIEVFPNSIRVMKKYSQWKLEDLEENHQVVIDALMNMYK